MADAGAEQAVRTYLAALRDPSTLRDDDAISALEAELESTDDELKRVVLRQQIMDAKKPSVEQYEDQFVEHARAWADAHGVSAEAFTGEGVPPSVLRRAGFQVRGGRGRPAARRSSRQSRVSAEDVRKAIPRGTFTVKRLEELSGASTAVVRKVINAEVKAGKLKEVGPDPDHQGPGRAPTLYRK